MGWDMKDRYIEGGVLAGTGPFTLPTSFLPFLSAWHMDMVTLKTECPIDGRDWVSDD